MKNLEVISTAVSIIIKGALLAARWSGTARRRGLEKLRAMDDESKEKEILFLRDKVVELEAHISLLLRRIRKKEANQVQRLKVDLRSSSPSYAEFGLRSSWQHES